MRISVKSFFNDLNVNTRYYIKQFQRLGVNDRFFFSDSDLSLIKNELPQGRYKSAMVVERAKSLLEASSCQN